jgi:hypothetical protein
LTALEASACFPPAAERRPVQGLDGSHGGRDLNSAAGGQGEGSEDASRAAAHADEAERNRDALEAQNRRVRETAPDPVREDPRDR